MDSYSFKSVVAVSLPLLDPANKAYVTRVRYLRSLAYELSENWLDGTRLGPEKTELAERLDYCMAKLAHALSCDDMQKVREQPFFYDALALAGSGEAARALEVFCRGLEEAHSRLDWGLSPFGKGNGEPFIELVPGERKLREVPFESPLREDIEFLLAK